MPSENNANGAVIHEKGKKNGKGKHRKSLGWIIGVVVLILISATFILPTTVFSSTPKIRFGSYNGKDIVLEASYDNYFFNQLNTLSAAYQMNAQNMMQIYYQAFYQTVLQTALQEMADEAGISVSNRMLSQGLMQSGAYRAEDGSFDLEAYNAASTVDKDYLMDQIRANIPSQMVYQDLTSVKTSNAEMEFVSSLSSTPRTFQYITVDYSSYPDEEAVAFVNADPAPFTAMELSVITLPSESEAAEAALRIQNGEATFEETVAESSTDHYASENGSMGSVMYHDLASILVDSAEADTVFATAEGSLTEPIQGYSGWMVFRADSVPALADLSDADVLDDVKRYISANDSETMDIFLSAEADAIYAEAAVDFEGAADAHGLAITEVGASSYNPAYSSFILDFAGNDPEGLLYNAASSDPDFYSSLFTAEEGTVMAPESTGTSYIIARTGAEATPNQTMLSYLNMMYPSYAPIVAGQDIEQSVLSSESFEDNFLTTYFSKIMGVSAQ